MSIASISGATFRCNQSNRHEMPVGLKVPSLSLWITRLFVAIKATGTKCRLGTQPAP